MMRLMEELRRKRPIIPQYDSVRGNTNEVIAKLCEQQGFDLAMAIIDKKEK